jgi:GNAT superfamily N-acetyltransferase
MKIAYRNICQRAGDIEFLYRLLQERTASINISHRKLPPYYQHRAFWQSEPYPQVKIILLSEAYLQSLPVGYWYLTAENEIGIFIRKPWHGQGIGTRVLRHILSRNRGKRLLANINPRNEGSIRLFSKAGFTHIQNTYAFTGGANG